MLNIYYMSLQQSRTLFLLGDRVLISDFSPFSIWRAFPALIECRFHRRGGPVGGGAVGVVCGLQRHLLRTAN